MQKPKAWEIEMRECERHLQIFSCEETEEERAKGRRICTRVFIKANQPVTEYLGKVVEVGTGDRLGASNYVFFSGRGFLIDATIDDGSFARLINHSRAGNLVARQVPRQKRIVLYAKTDIMPHTELLYDYGDRENVEYLPWLGSWEPPKQNIPY
jgi:[histone H4]-lysine20 N-methyltransferase SETD8